MFMFAISPLTFSPGISGGEFKLRGGASTDPLMVAGPGAPLRPVDGEDWEALPLADAWEGEDEAVEQGPSGEIKFEPYFGISCPFLLLFLHLWLLLG